MIFKAIALFTVLLVVASSASSSAWDSSDSSILDESTPNGRFARDLTDLNQRLKFAFAFAKRSADKIDKPSFAFAKRSSAEQENSRFARFAKFADMNNLV
ncbi:unnamed protein product [Auanema sp. JU1783]|nr:unnamed protein product [Auanema sp. JU1783]